VEDCNTAEVSNWSNKQYRALITAACKAKDEEELREAASSLRKCNRIMLDTYGRKEYMSNRSLQDARNMFYSRVQMQPFGGNFSKDKRFQRSNWLCACGEAREEEAHLVGGECPVYGDLREEFPDTMGDEQLVDFFTMVLERRKELEEEEEENTRVSATTSVAGSASPPGRAGVLHC